MDDVVLASLSNRFVYSAMAVYVCAMVAYAAEVATLGRVPATQPQPAAGAVARGSLLVREPAAPPPPSRSERFGRIALSLTVLGFGLHLAAVLTRALSAGRVPWGNMYEFSLTGGLAVVGAYLVLLRRYPIRFLGIVLVPAVLFSLAIAMRVLYTESAALVPALRSGWIVVHVSSAILGTGLFTVGAALAVLHLVRSRAEAGGGPRGGWLAQLPPASRLDALSGSVHAIAFPLWTFVLMSGAIWAENAWGRYWGWDPKEVWTFIIWVVYAGYLHARATAGWRGHRSSYAALVGYGCLLFNYFGINLLVSGLHSYAF
ncbi:MAG: c-type cytochrome biogenesis protein CcsB [Actinomycetota bacterium]|nr:c-type cytochrome biogenesis protein CcsB [Actinomycetota bacterium]